MVPPKGHLQFFSPSPCPAVAAIVSAEFLHKGSAESKYSWDWQSKRSFDSAVASTGHAKTQPECNEPIMKNFPSQLACLGHCGLKKENKQLGNLECRANLSVCDGFDMIYVSWEPGVAWTQEITEGCVHGESERVVSSGVSSIRDAEQGATEGSLERSCRVHRALQNPAREHFVSSEVPRTYWTSLQGYSSLFPFNISNKNFSCWV